MRIKFTTDMDEFAREIRRGVKEGSKYNPDIVNPLLSEAAVSFGDYSYGGKSPGTLFYKNPALDIVMDFVLKQKDHELSKMIPKYKKYEKEIYEKGIATSEIAYNVDLRRDRNEERSNNLRTQIDEISDNDELTKNEKKKK